MAVAVGRLMEMAKECERVGGVNILSSQGSHWGRGDAIHARAAAGLFVKLCVIPLALSSARLSGGHALKSLARTAGVELLIVVPRVRERRRAYPK